MVPALAHAQLSLPFWGQDGLMSYNSAPGATGTGSALPPCTSICDVLSTGQRILYFGITIGLFVLAPLFILLGAFQILTSGGTPEKVTQGKKAITSVLVAVLFILFSFLMINTFFWLGAQIFFKPANLGGLEGSISPGSWASITCHPPEDATPLGEVPGAVDAGGAHQQYICQLANSSSTPSCYVNSGACQNAVKSGACKGTCVAARCQPTQVQHFTCKDPATGATSGCFITGQDDCQASCANKGNCVPSNCQ
jgi:hypothetical protein